MTTDHVLVLSANCQGLNDRKKRLDVLNYITDMQPNIVCLQDTHWTTSDEKSIRNIWKGECILNGTRSNARGVAILLSNNFEYHIDNILKDPLGNQIILDITICNIKLKIINLYAPNIDTPEFFSSLGSNLENGNQDYNLICGDLNLTLDPNMDSNNYKHINNPRSRHAPSKCHGRTQPLRYIPFSTSRITAIYLAQTKPFKASSLGLLHRFNLINGYSCK